MPRPALSWGCYGGQSSETKRLMGGDQNSGFMIAAESAELRVKLNLTALRSGVAIGGITAAGSCRLWHWLMKVAGRGKQVRRKLGTKLNSAVGAF